MEYRKEVQRAFDNGGTWGDRWEQWETILRQFGENVREECALLCESNIVDKEHNLEIDGINSCHEFDAKKIRSIKIE